jgi:hypothetical protein
MPKSPTVFPDRAVTDWLLEGDPTVRYRTLTNLLGLKESDKDVRRAREQVLDDPRIRHIRRRQNKSGYWGAERDIFTWWPAKDSTFYMLGVLADFGLRKEDPGIERACEYVLGAQLDCGAFGVRPPPRPLDCFTGILTESLAKFGYTADVRLGRAYEWLAGRQRVDGGFWCKNTGQPGGPRQDEPSCAFAALCVLGALTLHPRLRGSGTAKRCAAFLLKCWDNRGRLRYAGHDSQIGTGWEKLKYPFTDYRLLMYLDIMSRLPHVRKDPRIRDITRILISKRDSEGRFRPESIHRAWSDFDFGQKKQPSRWITFLANYIIKRIGHNAKPAF